MPLTETPAEPVNERVPLSGRRGALMLAVLCSVQFLDLLDASIVNVALPTIRRDLGFSQQSLQWVLSGYLLTYGGFLLLGGRAADLLGRRRVLVTGTTVFGVCSLIGGLATTAGVLVGARLAQGIGAAMMTPAALSILTTTFSEGRDRLKALGAWGAMAGLSSSAGVFLGGVLSDGPGWRWVLLVNLPVCVLVVVASFRLFRGERTSAPLAHFDTLGAVLGTGGMLLLVYAIIEAPDVGWSSARTIGELVAALLVLGLFALNELRSQNPLFPFTIFRIKGLAAADVTQLLALAGFYSMFFFVTLYMQNVLGYSPMKAGAAYLPVTAGVAIAAGLSSQLFARTGTRPVIVAGSLLGAAGIYLVSRIPVDGSYVGDLLPGLMTMSIGLGAVFVGVITAANAGVPADKAGLAASLINASQQVGAALGLAVISAIATARTTDLLSAADPPDQLVALTSGYRYALLASAAFVVGAALMGLRAANTRGDARPPEGHDTRSDEEQGMIKEAIDEQNRRVIDEFRARGGQVGGTFEGLPILLLRNVGARTGRSRVNPLAYQRLDGGTYAVFATNGGGPVHPDWFHNVTASGTAVVEVGEETLDVSVRVAEGDERERIWSRQKETTPLFVELDAATTRRIPVVILEPAGAHELDGR